MGHRQGEGRAGEARAALVDRYLGWRGDSRRVIQELSHYDTERVQPADQLRHARHAAQPRDRRQSASGCEVIPPGSRERSDTLIVGAGPAGLAVGAVLRRANASFTVLERSAHVADSWHRHYDRIHLHTPKRFSALPYRPFPRAYPRFPSRQQVVDYFADYARAFDIEPELGQDVRRCVRGGADDATWNVVTNSETFRARRVVIATG
ncbi:MAG TPA: NAD(P)-binding domain-containing protein, partial [Gemmatimonadaceae bacterium]